MVATPKYEPLRAFLASRPPEVAEVTLTLVEVAALLGSPLPATAGRPSFWTNATDVPRPPVQVHAWRRAGWRVARFDPATRIVTFARLDARP